MVSQCVAQQRHAPDPRHEPSHVQSAGRRAGDARRWAALSTYPPEQLAGGVMGTRYIADFPDATPARSVAQFSNDRARLFHAITRLIEHLVQTSSGLDADQGDDAYHLDVTQYVAFFERFWDEGWLSDQQTSFVAGWTPWAAGIYENITLESVRWIDRHGYELQSQRYVLDEPALEDMLSTRQHATDRPVRRPKANSRNITV